MMRHRCNPGRLDTEVVGPDPQGRYAILCVDCGTILVIADDREELYADL